MKKVISILLVLCVAVTLFAAGSVKVGGAFNFVTGATRDFKQTIAAGTEVDVDTKTSATYKTSGFGFDISGDFDVANNLVVWADFNMVFGADAKFKLGDMAEESIEDQYAILAKETDKAFKKVNIISFGAGVAYKLALDPVDVKLGGGLFLDRALGKVGVDGYSDTYDFYELFKGVNFGLSLYADAAYKFNKNFGIGLTLMPHIGLYNSTTSSQYEKTTGSWKAEYEIKAKGFKLSYAMPIVLGVSYSF